MKHLNLVLLLIAFSSLGLHCKKEEPSELSKLPPITNFGAQTFGCLINGKAWTAEYGQVQIDFLMVFYQSRLIGQIMRDYLNP